MQQCATANSVLINYIRSTSVHYSTLRNMLSNLYHDVPMLGHNITEYEDLVIENTDLCLGEECIQGIGKVFASPP